MIDIAAARRTQAAEDVVVIVVVEGRQLRTNLVARRKDIRPKKVDANFLVLGNFRLQVRIVYEEAFVVPVLSRRLGGRYPSLYCP